MTTLNRITLTAGLVLLALFSIPLLAYVHLKRLFLTRILHKTNPLRLISLFLLLLPALQGRAQITITFTGITNNPVCHNNGTITAVPSGGTAPYTYTWTRYPSSGTLPSTASLTNVAAGYYSLQVQDATGNSGYGSYSFASILQKSMSATNANCPQLNGTATATVTAGGVAPYTYAWSNGQMTTGTNSTTNTITGLGGGSYDCIITDANGCTCIPDSVSYVASLTNLTISISTTPSNCNDGTATAVPSNGVAPYTYYWNTVPAQTTATATHLVQNTYVNPIVTDAQGCMAYGYAYVNAGPNAIQSTSTEQDAVCPAHNGSITLSISGGTTPYTYSWSNGATTATASGLASGSYSVQVTDAGGCTLNMNKYIGETSTVYATVSTTDITGCTGNTGTATVSVTGGQAPYAYLWNTSQTTASIGSLASGSYNVQVTDANGCRNAVPWSAWGEVGIPASCYSTIIGTVYNDMNGNCMLDPGDYGMPYFILNVSPNCYATTNYQGTYYISSLNAGTVNIAQTPPTNWTQICPNAPTTYSIPTVPGNTYWNNDFYDKPNSLFDDLQISISPAAARPGFDQTYFVYVYNKGTTTLNPTITFVHDPAITYVNCIPAASNYNASTQTVTFGSTGLMPLQSVSFSVTCHIPATMPIGTLLHAWGSVTPVVNDVFPADNADSSRFYTTGSYDPNAKTVMPKGNGPQGYISTHDKSLKYTIHFQNTGTDTAHLVLITDTLDPHLDIPSFRIGAASAKLTWDISGPGILTLRFPNIMLPDSGRNQSGSNGSVSYTINQLPNLMPGTTIQNKANIYFDYNRAVVTNTTLNTLTTFTGIQEEEWGSGVTVYPNPFTTEALLKINTDLPVQGANLAVYDLSGREVLNHTLQGKLTHIQRGNMDAGIYMYKVRDNSGHVIGQGKMVIAD